MARVDQDFELYQGEDKVIRFSITDDADAPVELSGTTATWVLASSLAGNEIALTKTVGNGITIDGTDYILTLISAETELLYGHFTHELRMIKDSLESVVAVGSATINRSLTN